MIDASHEEYRRSNRRDVPDPIPVIDSMSDTVIGRLGNLSETGMLLIASAPLTDDALYQLRFNLDGIGDGDVAIQVGAHLLWQDHTSLTGQTWTGFRFINLPEKHLKQLRRWLTTPRQGLGSASAR